MATRRKLPSESIVTRTVADFPGYVTAKEKLADVQARLDEVDVELRQDAEASAELREQRICAAAAAVLEGGTATALLPDLAELKNRHAVLTDAVRQQTEILERERQAAARTISDEVLPRYLKALAECLRLQTAANEAYDAMLAIRAETQRVGEGECFLPLVAMPPVQVSQFRHYFGTFKTFAAEHITER